MIETTGKKRFVLTDSLMWCFIFFVTVMCSSCGTGSKLVDAMKDAPQTTVTQNADKSTTTTYAPGELPEVLELELLADCRQWKRDEAEAERAERNAMLDLSMSDMVSDAKMGFYAMMTIHGDTMAYLTTRDGKYQQDECKPGTNRWDAYIAEVEENGRTYRQYSSDGKGMVTTGIQWVSGTIAATKIFESSGKTTVGGDQTIAGRDMQKDSPKATFSGTEEHKTDTDSIVSNADEDVSVTHENKVPNPTEEISVEDLEADAKAE